MAATFRSLKHRDYRLYFLGQIVSFTGSWAQSAALMWLVYDRTNAPGWPAFLLVAQVAPTLILGPWGGSLADRLPRKKLVLVTQTAFALTATALTLVVALDKFGFQIAPLVAGIGVAGLGIGIALQGVLSNVVAGLSIIFTKPFRVGEYIALLGVQGEVSVIELFSTTLVHPDRSRVVIPNRKIVGEILHNYGAVRQLALSVQVGYGSDLGQVLTTAREVVAGNARVLRDLPPVIGVGGLGGGVLTVNVGPWVAATDYIPAEAELYQALVEGFRTRHIELGGLTEVRLVQGA
jgi:small conductance mechanosensitive channel